MKKHIFFCALLCSTTLFAQQKPQPAPAPQQQSQQAQSLKSTDFASDNSSRHEIGVNATTLMKQVLNFSNTTFPLLPYDLTYKYIRNNSAIRVGLGILIDNTKAESKATSTGTTQPPAGPNQEVPKTSNSINASYRVGWEHRMALSSKLLTTFGFDITGQYGNIQAQSSQLFNNLPNSYSFSKTTDKTDIIGIGGGPVCGLQLFLTKRLSIFTEVPLYFQYTSQKEVTTDLRVVDQSGGQFLETTNVNTDKTSGTKLNLILPVTIYLAIRF